MPITQVAWPPPIPMANLGSMGLQGLALEVDRANGQYHTVSGGDAAADPYPDRK